MITDAHTRFFSPRVFYMFFFSLRGENKNNPHMTIIISRQPFPKNVIKDSTRFYGNVLPVLDNAFADDKRARIRDKQIEPCTRSKGFEFEKNKSMKTK